MNGIYLLLGTNLGDRANNLEKAIIQLQKANINVKKCSSIYETAAWGKTDQQDFLNQVIEVTTDLTPYQLLDTILKIELSLGRLRKEKWGERLIDIDILFFHNEEISTESLNIPHPAISERMFTLKPLAEIAGNEIHPKLQQNINSILEACSDTLPVSVWK